MTTITAQQILDDNNYETTKINSNVTTALTRVERLIDRAINHINLQTGSTISNMSGSDGSKTVEVTSNEGASLVESLASLLVRAYVDKGPNVGLSALTVNTVIADPQYALLSDMIKKDIERLREILTEFDVSIV